MPEHQTQGDMLNHTLVSEKFLGLPFLLHSCLRPAIQAHVKVYTGSPAQTTICTLTVVRRTFKCVAKDLLAYLLGCPLFLRICTRMQRLGALPQQLRHTVMLHHVHWMGKWNVVRTRGSLALNFCLSAFRSSSKEAANVLQLCTQVTAERSTPCYCWTKAYLRR